MNETRFDTTLDKREVFQAPLQITYNWGQLPLPS